MYTLPDAVRLKEHVLERWEAGRQGSEPRRGRRAQRRRRRRRPDRRRDRRRAGRALPTATSRRTTRTCRRTRRAIILVEAGPELFSMFKPDIREYTEKALEKRTVEVMTGDAVASVAPTRVTLKSGTELEAHTLVWGAGLQGNELVQSLGLELRAREPHRRRPGVDDPGASRGVRRRATSPRSPTRRRAGAPAARLGRPAVRRARRRDDRASASRARRRSRSSTATRARWRRSGAARPSCRCWAGKTMKGRRAQARLGHRAPRAAADQRGPREGRRRLGRRRAHAPARRSDHRATGGGARALGRLAMTRSSSTSSASAGTSPLLEKVTRHHPLRPRRRQGGQTAGSSASRRATVRVPEERRAPTARSAPTEPLFDRVASGEMNAMAAHAPRRHRSRGRLPSSWCISSGFSPDRPRRAADGCRATATAEEHERRPRQDPRRQHLRGQRLRAATSRRRSPTRPASSRSTRASSRNGC